MISVLAQIQMTPDRESGVLLFQPTIAWRDMIAPMTDRTTKLLLLLIALAIFANTVVSLARPVRVRAADSFSCEGTLKANAYGGIQATIGGYRVDIDCR